MKKTTALLMTAAMAIAIAGCSSDTESSTAVSSSASAATTAAAAAETTAAAEETAAAAEETTAAAQAETAAATESTEEESTGVEVTDYSMTDDEKAALQGKNISVMTPYLGSVTTNQMCGYLEDELTELGADVNVIDTSNDFAALASRIEDVVSAGTDAIILVSADPTQVENQLQEAFDANIPVFGVDSGFIDGMQVNATSDNYAMGEQIVSYLFDDLMGGKGTVIALTHRPHPGIIKRCEAFDDLLASHPDITEITEQHVPAEQPINDAQKIVEDLLLANPETGSITAIWAAWDEAAIGATQALQEAGRDEVIVTGVDGNEQAVELINEGTNLKATLAQNFEGMTQIVEQQLGKYFAGEEIEKGEMYAPANLITKDNS